MSELFSDEFLSAYIDGELSPHERAAVERWIERSPEARQRVEEFRGLSRLFGDLSRTEVPSEFSTEVLHLAERRMLLPDATAAGGRKRLLGWGLKLAVPTAAAAVILLMLTMSNHNDQARHRGLGQNGARPESVDNRSGNQPDRLIAQSEPQSRVADQPLAGGAGGAMPPAAPTSSPSASGAGDAKSATAKSATGAAGPATSKVAATASEKPLSESTESDRQLQAINDAVQEINESGAADKFVLLVKMRVVDRAEGLVLLQEDFAANNIRVEAGQATPGKPAADASPKGQKNYEGLYVEAQVDAVIAGFKATLARHYPGVRFSVESSIELAALDGESRKQLSLTDVDDPQATAADKSSRADDADGKVGKKSSPSVAQRKDSAPGPSARTNSPLRPGDRNTERSASAPLPKNKDAEADEKESPGVPDGNQMANSARHVVVQVAPQAIQNRGRSAGETNSGARNNGGSPKQETPAGETTARDQKPLAKDKVKQDEPAPSLVRMLIVIETEPPSPDAPASKKGSSGGAS